MPHEKMNMFVDTILLTSSNLQWASFWAQNDTVYL